LGQAPNSFGVELNCVKGEVVELLFGEAVNLGEVERLKCVLPGKIFFTNGVNAGNLFVEVHLFNLRWRRIFGNVARGDVFGVRYRVRRRRDNAEGSCSKGRWRKNG